MMIRTYSLLLAIAVIFISGCALTTTRTHLDIDESQTIDLTEIRETLENPSEQKIPVTKGDTITIITNKSVKLSSGQLHRLKMVVTKVDAASVEGNVLDSYHSGFIQVKLEDIDEIRFWKPRTVSAPLPGQVVRKTTNLTLFLLVLLLAL